MFSDKPMGSSVEAASANAANMNLQYLQMIQLQNFVRNLIGQQTLANQNFPSKPTEVNRTQVPTGSPSGLSLLNGEGSLKSSAIQENFYQAINLKFDDKILTKFSPPIRYEIK